MEKLKRRRTIVDESELARDIGGRLRVARHRAGLTQQQLAGDRYTKAYISALETGHAKPSMAALNYLAERLERSPAHFLGDEGGRWTRMEADLLLASGRWQDAADAFEELEALPADRPARAEILRGRSEALCRLGRGMEAIQPATEATQLFRQVGRERDAALADYWLANALYLAENTAEARSILRSLLDAIRGGLEVEADLQMRLLTALAAVETWDGNHRGAVTYLEEARTSARDLDDRRRAAFLSALAVAYHDSGDVEGAIRMGSASLALFTAAEAKHETALLENHLANAYVAVGNLARAEELVAGARSKHEHLGDERELAHVLDTEARIHLARGQAEEAHALATKAVAAAREVDNGKALSDALVTAARAQVQLHRPAEAIASYEQAAELVREHGPQARLEQILAEWADVMAQLGDHERAYRLTREALRRAT